jgi:hypothetical protein
MIVFHGEFCKIEYPKALVLPDKNFHNRCRYQIFFFGLDAYETSVCVAVACRSDRDFFVSRHPHAKDPSPARCCPARIRELVIERSQAWSPLAKHPRPFRGPLWPIRQRARRKLCIRRLGAERRCDSPGTGFGDTTAGATLCATWMTS